jgi:hypothetical protein
MSESSQSSSSEQGSNNSSKASNWSEAITKIIDKLVSKDVSVMYTFDHLEIDVPQARGPGGKELVGAKWVIDGKITITSTSATGAINKEELTGSNKRSESLTDSSKYVTA